MNWRQRADHEERLARRLALFVVLLLLAIAVGLCGLARASPPWHRAILEAAAAEGLDPYLGRELLHVEALAGVPDRWRGFLVAKAVSESRGSPDALGDWRGKGRRRRAMAVGLLQLWPWAKVDRTDPIASAHAYLGAVVGGLRGLRRRCPAWRGDPWHLAIIRVNRGPRWRREDRRGEPRCSGSAPGALRRLRRWRISAGNNRPG